MNWAYIAGFFDGEGTMRIRKTKKGTLSTTELGFANTQREVLETIRNFLGFGTIAEHWDRNPNHAPSVELYLYGHEKILLLLKRMSPYLIVKKDEAKQMLEFISEREWNRERRFKLKDTTKEELEALQNTMTQNEMAAHFGVNQSSLWRRLKKLGVHTFPKRKQGWRG